ncbi:MAG: response regulator transcription factor, partial [Lachnospiraceae bacterium]|nr:response regulator transcription factor [Lachnospiraceae bacterium]
LYYPAALADFEQLLTELELTVAKYIADGLSNQEIADRTSYSYGYIKRVVSTILEKAEMKKRSGIRKYLKEGITDDGEEEDEDRLER